MSNIDKTFEILQEENRKLREKLRNTSEFKSNIDYKLELVSGTYIAFEQIIIELKEKNNAIQQIYKSNLIREERYKQIKERYLDKYIVKYKFTKIDMPTVNCYYMEPKFGDFLDPIYYDPTIRLEIDNETYINIYYCKNEEIYNINPIRIKIYVPIEAYKDYISSDNALYIDKVEVKDTGKGYMNILMCLASKFANEILRKDIFLIYASSFGKVSDIILKEKIYPSFGFKATKGYDSRMYASIEDIVKLNKCMDLKVKN